MSECFKYCKSISQETQYICILNICSSSQIHYQSIMVSVFNLEKWHILKVSNTLWPSMVDVENVSLQIEYMCI